MKLETSHIIRRHRNGAIDTAYYLQRGRVARSKAAYRSMSRIRKGAHNLAAQLSARVSISLMGHRTSIS